jgi:hypothetical protein
MSRYLYRQSGEVIGYFDSQDHYLYSNSGSVIAYFDSNRKYMYKQDGTIYGYVGGLIRKVPLCTDW